MHKRDVTNRQPRLSVLWGVLPGLLVGILIAPVAGEAQYHLHVPDPDDFKGLAGVSPWYWLSWVIAYLVLALPAALLAIRPRTRFIAIGYLVPALMIGGLVTVFWASMDIYGFGPDH